MIKQLSNSFKHSSLILFIILISIFIPSSLHAKFYFADKIVTIQQKSTMRYLDAHVTADKDFRLVTRPRQNNKTQQWRMKSLNNNLFIITQMSSHRFIDAHEYQGKDFGLVTREKQFNTTQQWIVKRDGNNLYRIQQKSNGRYVDAHVTQGRDYEVVTRSYQNNSTQQWIIKTVESDNSTSKISKIQLPVSIFTNIIKKRFNGLKIHLNNYGSRHGNSWYKGNSSYIKLPPFLNNKSYSFSIDPINKFPYRYYINDINLESFNITAKQNRFLIQFNFEEHGTEIKGRCSNNPILCIKGSDSSAPDIQMNHAVASVYLTPTVRNNSISYSNVSTKFKANITVGKTCKALGSLCTSIFDYKSKIKQEVEKSMQILLDKNFIRNKIASAIRGELSKHRVKKIISAKIQGDMMIIHFTL